jgi:hypothetical protein
LLTLPGDSSPIEEDSAMGVFRESDSARVTRATIDVTLATVQDPLYVVNADYYRTKRYPWEEVKGLVEGTEKILLFRKGQVVRKSEIDAAFPAATVTSLSPVTGLAAGGTAVTIKGTNLSAATGVTFGGVAATAVTVVDDKTVTCTTPAHAAGAVDVVVTDDSGTVTDAAAYTYA